MSELRFGGFAADMSEFGYLGFGAWFPSEEPEAELSATRLLLRDPATRATIDCRGEFDLTTPDTALESHADWVELRTGDGELLFTWSGIRITLLQILYAGEGSFLWEEALVGPDAIFGSPKGDVLRGYAGIDTIEGGTGDDTITGGGGDDRLDGGDGADMFEGGDGADRIDGGAGADHLLAGTGADHALGGDGADTLDGDAGTDTLAGEGGNDLLVGGDNNDLLDGGPGDDALAGGDGVDVARFAGRLGDHLITVTDPLHGRFRLTDLRTDDGDNGHDALVDVESVQFAGSEMAVSLPPDSVPVGATLTPLAALSGPHLEQDWAVLEDGSAVLVWREYDTGGGGIDLIRAQRFDAELVARGEPIEVARSPSTGGEHAFSPSVTPVADGGFAIAWTRSFYDGNGANEDTHARVFTADGAPAGDAFDLGAGDGIQRAAKLAPTPEGGFVAVWFEGGWEGGIDAQRFDALGARVGERFEVTGAAAYAFEPLFDIATLHDGALAVVWTSNGFQAGTSEAPALQGRLIGSDGVAVVPLDLTGTTGYVSKPALAPLIDGGFAIGWSAYQEAVPIQDYARGVYVQRFDGLGSIHGERIEAASPSPMRSADPPTLTGTLDGGFAVAWGQFDIQGRRFDAEGAPIGARAFVANPSRDLDTGLYGPAALLLGDGDFLLAWTASAYQTHRLQAQRFSSDWDATRYTTFTAGLADDGLRAGDGAARFAGGAGNDTLQGGDAADWLEGQGGIDTVVFRGFLDDYAFSRSGGVLRVADQVPGRDDTDRIDGMERLQFDDVSLNLTVRETATSIPVSSLDRLCELYVGFFGRVPAANGLEHWILQFRSGKPIDRIADDFYGIGSSPELRGFTGYWDFSRDAELTNADYVRIVYRNVLGREGRPEGIDYWSGELDGSRESRGSLVSTMLDAAHGLETDARWAWVPTLLDDRTTMSKRIAVEWGLNYALDPGEAITKGSMIADAVRTEPNPDPAREDIPVLIFDFDAAVELVGFDPSVLDLLG